MSKVAFPVSYRLNGEGSAEGLLVVGNCSKRRGLSNSSRRLFKERLELLDRSVFGTLLEVGDVMEVPEKAVKSCSMG